MRKTLGNDDAAAMSDVHMEQERAAYITGRNTCERESLIQKLWEEIRGNTEYYRAPGHHPVSSPELIKSTAITSLHSELQIDHKPGRHILYMDTLDLALRHAHTRIQVRLELKQKQKKGVLRERFAEATIKIGSKADQRIEESVKIDLDILRQKGFFQAMQAGLDKEIKELRKCGKKEDAQKRKKKQQTLTQAFQDAMGFTSNRNLGKLDLFPLIHLHRDTREAEYSPNGYEGTIFEVKTDNCIWETPIDSQDQEGKFAQLEVESIRGQDVTCDDEIELLRKKVCDTRIVRTSDSKEDRGMDALSVILLPQNNSKEELQRVLYNRKILRDQLDPVMFDKVDPRSSGLRMTPA